MNSLDMTPKGQASQLDFSSYYMDTLATKYQPTDKKEPSNFKELVKRYDALSQADDSKETAQKNQDAFDLAQMANEIRRSNAKIADVSVVISRANNTLEAIRAAKTVQENLIAKTDKQPGTQDYDKMVQKLDGLKTDAADQQLVVDRLGNDKIELEAEKKQRESERDALAKKEYQFSETERRNIRAQITKDFIAIADFNYYSFKTDLLAGRAQADTLLDIAELAIASATTLTGGVMAKTNLGASSALLKGSRSTIDKNFFAQQTMRAIINAMEDGRATDKKAILENLRKSTSDYPLSEAISDVMKYQSRASLFVAILDIANTTGTNATKKQEELNNTVKATVPATSTVAAVSPPATSSTQPVAEAAVTAPVK